MPLHIQLLPTSPGDRSQIQCLTTFIINGTVALDAGSLGFALQGEELARVGSVILTHSHLDHVASLPMAIAELFPKLRRPIKVYGTQVVIQAVQEHILNGVIWPDFSRIKMLGSERMAVEFVTIVPGAPFSIDGIEFTAVEVNHEVPTVGIVARTADAAVAFTSDTGITDAIWSAASAQPNLRAVFVDCSFPDELAELAIQSGHLTPAQVAAEAKKLNRPAKIMCVHIKPDTREKVLEEIAAHAQHGMSAVEIGRTYRFDATACS